jgi:muramidase (phage lysozyme)
MAKGIPAEGQALLRTIGGPGFESNGSYTQRFNQPDFTDFSKHPGTYGKITRGPNAGLNSNAAGRYQFLSTTFNQQKTKQGLKDFSPESQDQAAWGLAQDAYAREMHGRSLSADLKNPDNLPMIARALKSQWSSLPGGAEQGSNMAQFAQAFQANLAASQAPTGVARAPAAAPVQEVGFPQNPWMIRGAMPTTQLAGGLGI